MSRLRPADAFEVLNENGRIPAAVLHTALRGAGLNLDRDQIDICIKDAGGSCDAGGFEKVCQKHKLDDEAINEKSVGGAMRKLFDRDGSGTFLVEDLRNTLKSLDMPEDYVKHAVERLIKKGGGGDKLSFDAVVATMFCAFKELGDPEEEAGDVDVTDGDLPPELAKEMKELEGPESVISDEIKQLKRGTTEEVIKDCVQKKIMFVDEEFPPSKGSIGASNEKDDPFAEVGWKRPRSLAEVGLSKLFGKDIDPTDVKQGALEDGWFLGAVAALAEFPAKIKDIFAHPVDEKYSADEQQVGAYRVTLNKHGWWHVLVVDDYLPAKGNSVLFARSTEPQEVWVSLLEKAYAKLHGSYRQLIDGYMEHAVQDLTGCPTQWLTKPWSEAAKEGGSKADELFMRLKENDEKKYILGCNTQQVDFSLRSKKAQYQKELDELKKKYAAVGLRPCCQYTILQVKEVGRLRMLQLRSPWGPGTEWTGKWSDDDSAWSQSPEVAKELNFKAGSDGKFWMEWQDVLKYFSSGMIGYLKFGWFDYRVRGQFTQGHANIALHVHVTKPVKVIITLSQKDRRALSTAKDSDREVKGIVIQVSRQKEQGKQTPCAFSTVEIEKFGKKFEGYCTMRDVSIAYTFDPAKGPYVITPAVDEKATKHYCIGILAESDDIKISFRKPTPKFFHSAEFSLASFEEVEAEYQYNPESGAPVTLKGKEFTRKK